MPTTWTLRVGACLVDSRGVRATCVLDRAGERGAAAERAGAAGEEVRLGRVGRERRGIEGLGDAPGGQRGQHDPGHAGASRAVPHAAGEDAELLRGRGLLALVGVVLAGLAAAVVGAAAEVAQARVAARAAVVDAGGGDVADRAARGAQARLPLLLVARARQLGVERPGLGEGFAGEGEVRAPQELGVLVGRAEVERGDRQRLAAAGAEARVLEDAGGSGRRSRRRRRVEQRVQPAGPDAHVVVEQADQVARRVRDAGVAGDVDALRAAERDVAPVVALDQLAGQRVLGLVLDDHDLGAVRCGLRRDRRKRHLEVVAPPAGREADRRGEPHGRRQG